MGTTGQPPPAPRGRPRGPSRDVLAAVVDATGAELAAAGYPGLSMERVAERARVHRSTLYKHWPTKRDLVVAFARHSYAERLPAPDTGTWEGDLRALVHDLAGSLAAPTSRALFGALATAGHSDPELRSAVLEMWRADTEPHLTPIERAKARGEIAGDVDSGLLLEAISAPLIERLCVTGAPVTPQFVEFTVEILLRGTRPG